ncbi:uncharacterized protein LOC134438514 isoform X2 [Engraulis encrasicolus]|uniref:uncharacterized protein LOC134438514 isoform X1 n=1 Tax=Engraulis encrasicolus TaxID=184585 RepID=UPI002FCF7687
MHRGAPFLGILLGLASMTLQWSEPYESARSVGVCSGQEYVFMLPPSMRPNRVYKYPLIFRRLRPKGRERTIANATQSLDPAYGFRDNRPYIPEVSKEYEGEYYWKHILGRYKERHIELYVEDCSEEKWVTYGKELRLSVPYSAVVLEFEHNSNPPSVVLWSKLNAGLERGARGTVKSGYWTAERATAADAGRYSFLNSRDVVFSGTRFTVVALRERLHMPDVIPDWTRDVPIPLLEVKVTYDGMVLFKDGLVTPEAFKVFGNRIRLQATDTGSKFTLMSVRTSDAGHYAFIDSIDTLAMDLSLEGEYTQVKRHDPYAVIIPISITLGVLMGLTICCWTCGKLIPDQKEEDAATLPGEESNIIVHETLVMPGTASPLQPTAPSSDNIEPPPSDPWANSPPPYFSVGSTSNRPVPQSPVSDPAPSSYQPPAPYVPYQPYIPDPVSSLPPSYDSCVTHQPTDSDAPSSYEPPASLYEPPPPYVPYQPPSEATATAAGGAGDISVSTAPTVDLESQFQPRGWGGAMDDFLSSSVLCMDSNTPEGATAAGRGGDSSAPTSPPAPTTRATPTDPTVDPESFLDEFLAEFL